MKTRLLTLFYASSCVMASAAGKSESKFTATFPLEPGELASIGTNHFFVLAPGYQMVLEGKAGGETTVLTITVLNETKMIDGVETRIVEEKETVNGEPEEISRNYFAISRRTSDVFYFGEDVDMYKNGKVTSHDGAWLSGVAGAHFGLGMPGSPLLGARYQQELAPKVAMDRAEVVCLSEHMTTPAGSFTNCLKTEESSTLEKTIEHKIYAPGVGLIYDGELKLKQYGFTRP